MEPTPPTASGRAPRGASFAWTDLGRLLAAAAAFLVLAYLVRARYADLEAWLVGLGAWAPVALILVHAVAVPLGFPVSVLGFLAGATFGWLAGTALLLAAGLVSASLMYLLSRHLLAARVHAWTLRRPRLARLLDLARRDSVRLMVLLRLSPLHFATVCYLLGAGRVRFVPYLLTTLLLLPSAAFQASVGNAARVVGQDVATSGAVQTGRLALLAAGLAATAALTVLLGRMARRALAATTHNDGSEGT